MPTHELLLPDPPGRIQTLGSPSDRLVHAGPASPRPFLVASPGVEVHGSETGGVERVLVRNREVLRSLRTGAGPCSTVLLGPRGTRRTLVGPGGTVLETLLVADRHPASLIQWTTPSGGDLALDLRWDVPGTIVAHRSNGPLLRVRPEGGVDRLFAVWPAPDRWRIDAGVDGLTVQVRVRTRGEPVSLVAAEIDPAEDGNALLRALARTDVLETRTEAFLGRVRREWLATRTGVTQIDDGLAWAVARVTGAGVRERGPGTPLNGPRSAFSAASPLVSSPPMRRLWTVVGILAAGDPEGARAWIGSEPEGVAAALTLGWWVRWTGDAGPFLRHREAVVRILSPASGRDRPEEATTRTGRAHPEAAVAAALRRAARKAAWEAFEAAGDDAAAQSVRPAATEGRADRGGLHLPMRAGEDEPAAEGAALGPRLLGAILGDPVAATSAEAPLLASSTPISSGSGGDRALHAWALYALGRADEAYSLLRRHLTQGSTPPPGLWLAGPHGDPPDPTRYGDGSVDHDPVAAALAPAVLLHGLLGAGAEASWGRLRLSPSLPSSWNRFEVGGIRVADARVSLGYARRKGTHTFTLEQTAGRVPLDLVFEPSVPGRVRAVRVDGQSTDVAPERRTDRSRIRLQLPLDAERTVTLVGSDT